MLFRKTMRPHWRFAAIGLLQVRGIRRYASVAEMGSILNLLTNTASGGLSESEGFDLSFFDSTFSPVAFFDEVPVDGGSSGESGSSGDGSDVATPNGGAPDNNTSNGENSNEGASDENASGEESLEGNASDEVSDAEQDAAQIEGA
ncbi:MAG: hypothetical protein ACLT98_17075, partial [Eggerthellaceae bacterium]